MIIFDHERIRFRAVGKVEGKRGCDEKRRIYWMIAPDGRCATGGAEAASGRRVAGTRKVERGIGNDLTP
jgi:hypothetical protein